MVQGGTASCSDVEGTESCSDASCSSVGYGGYVVHCLSLETVWGFAVVLSTGGISGKFSVDVRLCRSVLGLIFYKDLLAQKIVSVQFSNRFP